MFGTAHILVDVNGYFPTGSDFGSVTPFRLEDTRPGGVKVGSFDGSAGPLRVKVPVVAVCRRRVSMRCR